MPWPATGLFYFAAVVFPAAPSPEFRAPIRIVMPRGPQMQVAEKSPARPLFRVPRPVSRFSIPPARFEGTPFSSWVELPVVRLWRGHLGVSGYYSEMSHSAASLSEINARVWARHDPAFRQSESARVGLRFTFSVNRAGLHSAWK